MDETKRYYGAPSVLCLSCEHTRYASNCYSCAIANTWKNGRVLINIRKNERVCSARTYYKLYHNHTSVVRFGTFSLS